MQTDLNAFKTNLQKEFKADLSENGEILKKAVNISKETINQLNQCAEDIVKIREYKYVNEFVD